MLEALDIFWANTEGFKVVNVDGDQVNTDGPNENGVQYCKEGITLFIHGKSANFIAYSDVPDKQLADILRIMCGIFKIDHPYANV